MLTYHKFDHITSPVVRGVLHPWLPVPPRTQFKVASTTVNGPASALQWLNFLAGQIIVLC